MNAEEENDVTGIRFLGVGIGFIVLAIMLCIIKWIYKKTAGENIKKQVRQEYEKA